MSYPPPNVGPNEEAKRKEFVLLELYFPVWGSLTGAHPGLFTSENKNALESYWYVLLEASKEKGIENSCHLRLSESWYTTYTALVKPLYAATATACDEVKTKQKNRGSCRIMNFWLHVLYRAIDVI